MITGTARMVGSSIVAPSAAGWVTAFLNGVFYTRPAAERSVEDLRLAHCLFATRWARAQRRVGLRERGAFRRAFGRIHGQMEPGELQAGAVRLLGDGFATAWDDPERRAHGIVFDSAQERAAFDPSLRLRHGRLRGLTPPRRPPERQVWATYPPVRLPEADAALALLRDPARWPDFASCAGRFTAVRAGGLEGQTFEIQLAMHPSAHTLFWTRGYVTCTTALGEGAALEAAVDELRQHAPDAVPEGAHALALIELTTHRGHFMGRGISRLIVYEEAGEAFVCDVGSWDPMPPQLAIAYRAGGHAAQLAFWGPDDPEAGMLAQLALVAGARAGERS